jgi:hypothetical protein
LARRCIGGGLLSPIAQEDSGMPRSIYLDVFHEGISLSDDTGEAVADLDRREAEALLAAAEMVGLLAGDDRKFDIVIRNATGSTVARLRLSSETVA